MSAEAVDSNKPVQKLDPTNRICPPLSIATSIGRQPGEPFVATACQGIACALFMPVLDQNGEMTSGGCSITMLPQVMDAQAGQVGGLLKVLVSRAKITPAPGILG